MSSSMFLTDLEWLWVIHCPGGKRRQKKLHISLGMDEQNSDFLVLVTTFLPQRDEPLF